MAFHRTPASEPTEHTLLHHQLVISPLNVRHHGPDAEEVTALAASIVAEGLHHNLSVHPPLEDMAPETLGIFAGGRRWRAIGMAIADGRLPADFPIRVVIRDLAPADIVIASLGENLLRRDLQPWETHRAVADAHARGMAVADIAGNSGQTVQWVERQLRLGTLAMPVFDAYRAGAITMEQASAYAATADHALQMAAWAHFQDQPSWRSQAADIRRWLRVGDAQLERELQFVGDIHYRAAGGRFELDLFAGDQTSRGRIVDPDILTGLVQEMLEGERCRLRAATRRALTFAKQPPQRNGYEDRDLELHPQKRGTTLFLPKGQPDDAFVVTLDILAEGQCNARFWWASRKAMNAARREGAPAAQPMTPVIEGAALSSDFHGRTARQQLRDAHGLTADGIEVIRHLRRELLRTRLVADVATGGTLGRDYAVWALLRGELRNAGIVSLGARKLGGDGFEDYVASTPSDLIEGHLQDSVAHAYWLDQLNTLHQQPFMQLDDHADSFDAFCDADDDIRALAGAVLAGLMLLRSANADGYRVPVHDRIARRARTTPEKLRIVWKPTASFAALFPKMKRLELAQPHVEAAAFKGWHKLDDKTLSGAVAGALENSPGWLHPMLTFDFADTPAAEQVPQADPAPALEMPAPASEMEVPA